MFFFLVKIVLAERVTKNVLRLRNNTQFESFLKKVRQQGRHYFISFFKDKTYQHLPSKINLLFFVLDQLL